MEMDLHIHTNRYSGCSNIEPLKVIKRAVKTGLTGIVLTQHGNGNSNVQSENVITHNLMNRNIRLII